ncbi:MAG: hypothetical protein OEV28_01560 [Nitrospirota bacterium]|nr:hypothetical protein [Nitrospirota bacterium]
MLGHIPQLDRGPLLDEELPYDLTVPGKDLGRRIGPVFLEIADLGQVLECSDRIGEGGSQGKGYDACDCIDD